MDTHTIKTLIRLAESADVPAMKQCVMEAFAPFRAKISGIPPIEDGLTDNMDGCINLVAENSGTVVGMAVVSCHNTTAVLKHLAVSPTAQGLGVGRALVIAAMEQARNHAAKALHLTTHCEMIETQKFYELQGFIETGREGTRVFMAHKI